MRHLLFTLLLLSYAIGNVNAQVCKISNSNDNIEVFSVFLNSPNQVQVVVSNDSKDIAANVTVKIKVTYGKSGNSKDKDFIGKALAKANGSTEFFIDIPEKDEYGRTAQKVQATDISGTKCLN